MKESRLAISKSILSGRGLIIFEVGSACHQTRDELVVNGKMRSLNDINLYQRIYWKGRSWK